MKPYEVLAAFDHLDGEARTVSEIASAGELSKPAAWKALEELEEDGLVEKQPGRGFQSDTWLITTDGTSFLRQRREK